MRTIVHNSSTGDEFPDITLAESMIDAIKELRKSNPKEEL